jgi:hypothetical protein
VLFHRIFLTLDNVRAAKKTPVAIPSAFLAKPMVNSYRILRAMTSNFVPNASTPVGSNRTSTANVIFSQMPVSVFRKNSSGRPRPCMASMNILPRQQRQKPQSIEEIRFPARVRLNDGGERL